MDSRGILYSAGRNDECMTLPYAVKPIIKYISPGSIVWCPFDKADSEFVQQISKAGFEVVHSHIDEGLDFYDYEPDLWNVIISNPPFTGKRRIFERALSFDKPFALIMSNTWLNDAAPKKLFMNKQLELLMFEQRMLFSNRGHIDKKITFSSSYFCHDFLPRQIIIESLEK